MIETPLRIALPKIYPITNAELSGLPHEEQVRLLLDGGATFIQVREKGAPSGDFFRSAAAAVQIGHERGAKIIINDRVDIALVTGADGVHLGQDDLHPEEARKILGPAAIIGFSTHSMEQALSAMSFPIDYIAIGPVFDTRTKSDPDPVVGVEGIRNVRQAIGHIPLVAIGGIRLENVSDVLSAGADSAAVISDIVGERGNISRRMAEFLGSSP